MIVFGYLKQFIESSILYNVPSHKIINYLYLRFKYKIGINDYFKNKLYTSCKEKEIYFKHLHTYIHSWKNVVKSFAYNWSKVNLFLAWWDYQITKLYCPGLDAMDYFRYEFHKLSPIARREFITEGGLMKMVEHFNGSKKAKLTADIFKNKSCFNTLFSEYIGRKWFVNEKSGIDDFCAKVLELNDIICKPLTGGGGKGIIMRNITTRHDAERLFNDIKNEPYIVEEVIHQHDSLAQICPASINTIRVYSIIANNQPIIIGAALRIGNGIDCTDNYSSGGFVAEIDAKTGLVISRAVSQDGLSVYVHPKTNVPIIGTIIPQWTEVQNIVKAAHLKVPEIGYIGWDVVVCKSGKVIFLEGNTNAGVELQQHAPLKGKKRIYDYYIKMGK